MKCDSAAGAAANIVIANPPSVSKTYYNRMYLNFANLPASGGIAIFRLAGSITVRITSAGKLQLWNEVSTATQIGSDSVATIATGTYYRVEVKFIVSAGQILTDAELQLDGVSVAIGTGLTANVSKSTVQLGWITTPGASKVFYVDDVAINDNGGSVNNTWPGSGKVVMLLPTGDSAEGAGWTRGNGTAFSGSNGWDSVNNEPPVGIADLGGAGADTGQIRNAGSNANSNMDVTVTTYTAAGIGASDVINAIQMWAITAAPVVTSAKQGTLGMAGNPGQTAVALGSGGTAGAFWQGNAGGTFPTGWKHSPGTVIEAPTGLTLGAAPTARVTQVTASTRIAVVCFMGAYVDYTPVSGTTYTKQEIGISPRTGSGPDVTTWADTGSGISPLTGGGADATTWAKTGIGISARTALGAKVFNPVETGIGISPRTGGGASASAFSIVVNPTIAGTPSVGHVLRCFPGAYTGGTPTFTYQWRRDGGNIGSATSATYTLVSADDTHTIDCRVSATSGSTISTNSDSVVCTSSVSITWDPTIRQSWEPDTLFLFDPDQESTFWTDGVHGMIDNAGYFSSLANCNPWRGGSAYSVVAGKFRRGIKQTGSGESLWIPGAMLPSNNFTVEFFAKCDISWGSSTYAEFLDFGRDMNTPVGARISIFNDPGLGGKVHVRVSMPDRSTFEFNDGINHSSGTWVGVQLTYDGSTLTLYIDGVSKATHSMSAPFAWYGEDTKGVGGLKTIAGSDWTISDIKISRVCRIPASSVTVKPQSSVTFSDTSAGSTTPDLYGGVHHFGTNSSDIAAGDTLKLKIARVGKLDSALPIKSGGTDVDHPTLGNSGSWSYHFGPADRLCQYFLDRGWKMYLSFGSCPQILGGGHAPFTTTQCNDSTVVGAENTVWDTTVPSSMANMGTICADIYHHMKNTYPTLVIEYVAIGNEPSSSAFWAGTATQMFQMYAAVANAIRAINGSQKVGGVETTDYESNKSAWVQAHINYCGTNAVPLDFISVHGYEGDINFGARVLADTAGWAATAGITAPKVTLGEWGWHAANTPGSIHPFGDSNFWMNDWAAAYDAAYLLACQAAGISAACIYQFGPSASSDTGWNGTGIIDATNHIPWASGNALREIAMLS
jgi:Glycosyl hydrolases family 39/Concanavalin A-like lectin/glucanases superfamily